MSSDARRDVCGRLGEGAPGSPTDRFASFELLAKSGIGENTKERALGSLSIGNRQVRFSSQPSEVLG